MALSTQPYKGARDFYPEDKQLQKYLFGVMRDVVESFGYQEYDAPILESLDLYRAKTGEEIVNEQVYSFEDRGGREVAIRPEMTPTASRMVAAKRQELAYPLRWYSIPNLWRYERPQKGRLREHWQLNVDLFGVDGLEGDHELVQLADKIMLAFGANHSDYVIKLNSRALADEVLGGYIGLNQQQTHDMSKLIDKREKLPAGEFDERAKEIIGLAADAAKSAVSKLNQLLDADSLSKLPASLANHESALRLNGLIDSLVKTGTTNVVFDMSLMRGFDYYTDIVFEVFDTDPSNSRSMFGGGRYDGLVGLFGVDPVPTVGFGLGDVTLQNFLKTHGLLPDLTAEADLFVVLVGDVYERSQELLNHLRQSGLKVFVDTSGRKPDKQLKAALKKGASKALFIGESELTNNVFKLKDLRSETETEASVERLVDLISSGGQSTKTLSSSKT